jgi:hypothetical protein
MQHLSVDGSAVISQPQLQPRISDELRTHATWLGTIP